MSDGIPGDSIEDNTSKTDTGNPYVTPQALRNFVAMVANLTKAGERLEGDSKFEMGADDATATVNRLIEDARTLLKPAQ